jgi:hypothetical protein
MGREKAGYESAPPCPLSDTLEKTPILLYILSMAKVIVSKLNPRGKKVAASRKRLKLADHTVYVITLNANSKTFGRDLTYAFEKNVEKARRENKKKLGAVWSEAKKKLSHSSKKVASANRSSART